MRRFIQAFSLRWCSFQTLLAVWREMTRIEAIEKIERTLLDRIFWRLAARGWYKAAHRFGGNIDFGVKLGRGIVFNHEFSGVTIASGARIGDRCRIMQNVTIGANLSVDGRAIVTETPWIGDDVFIGPGCQVIGRTKIGDRAKIGAGVTLANATIPAGATIINKSAYDLTNRRYVYPQDYALRLHEHSDEKE